MTNTAEPSVTTKAVGAPDRWLNRFRRINGEGVVHEFSCSCNPESRSHDRLVAGALQNMGDDFYMEDGLRSHYHPCGHCKQQETGFACFDTDESVIKHAGIYQLCDRCEDALIAIDPEPAS